MDAENERILEHLVGAGVLNNDEQTIVKAAAEIAARGQRQASQANILICNRNWCLVVRE